MLSGCPHHLVPRDPGPQIPPKAPGLGTMLPMARLFHTQVFPSQPGTGAAEEAGLPPSTGASEGSWASVSWTPGGLTLLPWRGSHYPASEPTHWLCCLASLSGSVRQLGGRGGPGGGERSR